MIEGRAALDLVEALGSSLDMRIVLERAYPSLLRLVPADCGALGVSSSGRPEDYRWIVAKLPSVFFSAYAEMAPHDVVRRSVTARPNVVLRDDDMVPRAELESNVLYRRAREIGAPLEQVMAVMLHIDHRWQSGLSLYREKRRPFSERERAALQRVTPAIVNAVRNCHLFASVSDWTVAIEALMGEQGAAIVLAAPPGTEVARTRTAAALVDRWFGPDERGRPGELPAPLVPLLARAGGAPLPPAVLPTWTRRGADSTLEIAFTPLPGCVGAASWMLVLKELCDDAALPVAWRVRLTPREREVSRAVLRGWDNALIAVELGCAAATVKKHLQNVFDKLGVKNRTALVARAAELRRS